MAWTLVIGPLLVKAWREAPGHGIAFLTGFYGVLLSGMVATALVFGLARRFGPGVSRVLTGISAAALAVFGCCLTFSGLAGLR
jgi:hypothetical protein